MSAPTTTLIDYRNAVLDTLRAAFGDVFAEYGSTEPDLFNPRDAMPELETPALFVSSGGFDIAGDVDPYKRLPVDAYMLVRILLRTDTPDFGWRLIELAHQVARVIAAQDCGGSNARRGTRWGLGAACGRAEQVAARPAEFVGADQPYGFDVYEISFDQRVYIAEQLPSGV